MSLRLRHLLLILLPLSSAITEAQNSYVSLTKNKGDFTLSASGKSASIYFSSLDYSGVHRAIQNLKADIGRVSDVEPQLTSASQPAEKEVVIIGTIGKFPLIDQLIKERKMDVSAITGKWENFLTQVIEKPFPNVDRALVIAGSDKRGTIFGIYDLSKQIGVSPWYWWADVPPKKSTTLYIKPGSFSDGPKVKYRGIFINDEQPALGGWVQKNFGGFNHNFYEKVYELILRMKGNYLWPAMWGQSFYSNDTLNAKLANDYGVVIGTSHHEPMMRAHAEWKNNGGAAWNYSTNEENLREFWKQGIERMGDNESIVTLAMRGDGDEPMSEESNVKLLQKIVNDQRDILTKLTGKEITAIPQVWALYKEVQDYYDKGMRVPDDVTLLLCDDNWGNIRKLPSLEEKKRAGGYGVYYHFDYVGGPRNYKWINTNQIERVWEQMNLAYNYSVDRIWIVNVGDIKPMEFPIEFFLDNAWNPNRWNPDNLNDFTRAWAEMQFGKKFADEIATILTTYTTYNARRKPELLSPDTYSHINFGEADKVVSDYKNLETRAEKIYGQLPNEYRDAFYQLVLYPVKASANLNELYVTVGRNKMYAEQGRTTTNELADKAKSLFAKDAELSNYYNKEVSHGKWDHFMDQTHIGYTNWQQPTQNEIPVLKSIDIPEEASMGVAVEGSAGWWPQSKTDFVLPAFDVYNQPTHYVDIFNRGKKPFDYKIKNNSKFIKVSSQQGKVQKEQRVYVSVDWKQVPTGNHTVPITIMSESKDSVVVSVRISNPLTPKRDQVEGFVESNGYISIEAEHFTNVVNSKDIQWKRIPHLAKTLSGVTSFPVTSKVQQPGGQSPHLEYKLFLFNAGEIKLHTYISPTLNFNGTSSLHYAVSIDDEAPQIVNMHEDASLRSWEKWVSDNIIIKTSNHKLTQAGEHVLKFWMVDPGVVFQKIVVETTSFPSSYLGPPESYNRNVSK